MSDVLVHEYAPTLDLGGKGGVQIDDLEMTLYCANTGIKKRLQNNPSLLVCVDPRIVSNTL